MATMKTRVIEQFSHKHGCNLYSVQKWALWDESDLREAYPDAYDWRWVQTFLDKSKAIEIATAISEHPDSDHTVVVWKSPEEV